MLEHKLIAEAWRAAALDLGIEVVAPYSVAVDGRLQEYLALVPHFGSEHGALVALSPSDEATNADAEVRALFKAAEKANYYCSLLDAEAYQRYDRKLFIETLVDWGFYGPPANRPAWLPEARTPDS